MAHRQPLSYIENFHRFLTFSWSLDGMEEPGEFDIPLQKRSLTPNTKKEELRMHKIGGMKSRKRVLLCINTERRHKW